MVAPDLAPIGIPSDISFSDQPEVMDGNQEIWDFKGVPMIMSSEPSSALTTFNNGQMIEVSDGIPGTEILGRGLDDMSFGILHENLSISNFDHHLGGSNHDNILGVESLGDVIENMTSHEILDLENLDPDLDLATFDLSFGIPDFEDSLRFASFNENHNAANHPTPDSQNLTFQPFPTLEEVNGDPLWLGLEAPLAGESLCNVDAALQLPGASYTAESGFVSPEANFSMSSFQENTFFARQLLTQGNAVCLPVREQSEIVTERQSTSAADINNAFATGTSLYSYVSDVDSGRKTVRKRNRHSDSEWKEVEMHIRRLYLDKGHIIEEVEFEMSVIHGFDASASTLRKRVAGWGKDKRLRTAKALPIAQPTRTPKIFEIISEEVRKMRVEERYRERKKHEEENEERRQLQIEMGNKNGIKKRRGKKMVGKDRHAGPHIIEVKIGPFLNTTYIYQEELFHSIDALLKGWFAVGSESWTTEAHHFKPPLNSTRNLSETWQLLSDQVASICLLVKEQLYHHANFMCKQVLVGLKDAARTCDPSFIVHFWTICHLLSGIPVCSKGSFPESIWIGWFLRNLQKNLPSGSAEHPHPLEVIVHSLLRVWAESPRDLKATLGLGHWKAIHTLGSLIGDHDHIVLNMGACCTKIWKSKFSASSTLVELLRKPLAVNACSFEAKQRAEVSLDVLYAAAKEKYNDMGVVQEASQLLSWTSDICREKAHQRTLKYNSVTRAFVFSSELIATHHLETWKEPEQKQNKQQDRELSYKCMRDAIDILQHGDQQCRIRAASFSKRLSIRIKGNPMKMGSRPKSFAMQEAKSNILREKTRTREIIRHINKLTIKGSRHARVVRGTLKKSPRNGLAVAKDLLLKSLLA